MTTTATSLITPEAIEELTPALFTFALRVVRRREEAEDLVQETWFSALRTAPTFEGRSSLRTWLTSILRRRIADRYRRERATEPFEEENHESGARVSYERLDVQAAALLANRSLAKLTELERSAIVLCDIKDFDRDEASEQLGVTRGHLRVLLHRARAKLEQSLRARGVQAA
jgi:RNA polymerase sigma-70 factor (ECF subfamily)